VDGHYPNHGNGHDVLRGGRFFLTPKTGKNILPFEEITFEKPAVPFKLCTTTYIYPADWVTNARALGRSFDELELLLFESAHPDSLPSPEAIQTLSALSAELDFSWNIHLPIDLRPGHPDRNMRQRAEDVIKQVVDLTAPLMPSTHTLHLPGIVGKPDDETLQRWLGRMQATLGRIADFGISGRSLTIENITDYALEMALPLIEAFDLEVCLDIGHLLVRGDSLHKAFETFRNRIALLHIHGVEAGRDHLGLDRLSSPVLLDLMAYLRGFTGVVSLEVFSKKNLLSSLECLIKEWP
jgi:sugar phosphate isomerase/epimerase